MMKNLVDWSNTRPNKPSKDEAASRLAQEDGQAILVADMIQWLGT